MKKIYLFILFALFASGLSSQTVPSSCAASDSITKIYEKDAARLAVRHVHRFGTNYKDSLAIDKVLLKTYRRALLAVHNATALPIHDTLINIFNIHTNPNPELNQLQVTASPNLAWMQDLMNNNPPTSYTLVSKLFAKYNLQYVYYQGAPQDQVTFFTDTNLNLSVLVPQFLADTNVSAAAPLLKFNDVTNITDSLNANFVILNYSIGWGTCNDTCDYRKVWSVKVHLSDCSVEYLGTSGDILFTSISENAGRLENTIIYPNPAKDHLNVSVPENAGTLRVSLFNAYGTLVKQHELTGSVTQLDISQLTEGLYIITIEGDGQRLIKKILKD